LEKAPINGEHVHVQICNFKTLKNLLLRPCYNKDHRKGLPNFLGQRVPKSNVEPLPKRRHVNRSDDVSIVDVSQEEPKFAYQMTKETHLIDQDTIITIGSNICETITHVLNSLDRAQQWDNKVDTNIQDHYTYQDMLEVASSCVSSPVHHKIRGEN
jgi:hypothetical protein